MNSVFSYLGNSQLRALSSADPRETNEGKPSPASSCSSSCPSNSSDSDRESSDSSRGSERKRRRRKHRRGMAETSAKVSCGSTSKCHPLILEPYCSSRIVSIAVALGTLAVLHRNGLRLYKQATDEEGAPPGTFVLQEARIGGGGDDGIKNAYMLCTPDPITDSSHYIPSKYNRYYCVVSGSDRTPHSVSVGSTAAHFSLHHERHGENRVVAAHFALLCVQPIQPDLRLPVVCTVDEVGNIVLFDVERAVATRLQSLPLFTSSSSSSSTFISPADAQTRARAAKGRELSALLEADTSAMRLAEKEAALVTFLEGNEPLMEPYSFRGGFSTQISLCGPCLEVCSHCGNLFSPEQTREDAKTFYTALTICISSRGPDLCTEDSACESEQSPMNASSAADYTRGNRSPVSHRQREPTASLSVTFLRIIWSRKGKAFILEEREVMKALASETLCDAGVAVCSLPYRIGSPMTIVTGTMDSENTESGESPLLRNWSACSGSLLSEVTCAAGVHRPLRSGIGSNAIVSLTCLGARTLQLPNADAAEPPQHGPRECFMAVTASGSVLLLIGEERSTSGITRGNDAGSSFQPRGDSLNQIEEERRTLERWLDEVEESSGDHDGAVQTNLGHYDDAGRAKAAARATRPGLEAPQLKEHMRMHVVFSFSADESITSRDLTVCFDHLQACTLLLIHESEAILSISVPVVPPLTQKSEKHSIFGGAEGSESATAAGTAAGKDTIMGSAAAYVSSAASLWPTGSLSPSTTVNWVSGWSTLANAWGRQAVPEPTPEERRNASGASDAHERPQESVTPPRLQQRQRQQATVPNESVLRSTYGHGLNIMRPLTSALAQWAERGNDGNDGGGTAAQRSGTVSRHSAASIADSGLAEKVTVASSISSAAAASHERLPTRSSSAQDGLTHRHDHDSSTAASEAAYVDGSTRRHRRSRRGDTLVCLAVESENEPKDERQARDTYVEKTVQSLLATFTLWDDNEGSLNDLARDSALLRVEAEEELQRHRIARAEKDDIRQAAVRWAVARDKLAEAAVAQQYKDYLHLSKFAAVYVHNIADDIADCLLAGKSFGRQFRAIRQSRVENHNHYGIFDFYSFFSSHSRGAEAVPQKLLDLQERDRCQYEINDMGLRHAAELAKLEPHDVVLLYQNEEREVSKGAVGPWMAQPTVPFEDHTGRVANLSDWNTTAGPREPTKWEWATTAESEEVLSSLGESALVLSRNPPTTQAGKTVQGSRKLRGWTVGPWRYAASWQAAEALGSFSALADHEALEHRVRRRELRRVRINKRIQADRNRLIDAQSEELRSLREELDM